MSSRCSLTACAEGVQLDFSEVCILNSQHARIIRTASEEGDWRPVFRVLGAFCKYNTVQRLLLPFNTSGNSIVRGTDTHWMLAELCFESKVVCIYDWLPGKFQRDYEQVAGVHCVCCFPFHVCSFLHWQGYFCARHRHVSSSRRILSLARVCVLSECLLTECLLHMCPLCLTAPHIQQNGNDCAVWAMYAMYIRAMKRATKTARAALFENMDMRNPQDDLHFRYPVSSQVSKPPCTVPHAFLSLSAPFNNCFLQPTILYACFVRPMYAHFLQPQSMLRTTCFLQPMLVYDCFMQPMYVHGLLSAAHASSISPCTAQTCT
jgi:hypothetical protein